MREGGVRPQAGGSREGHGRVTGGSWESHGRVIVQTIRFRVPGPTT